ncbi:MAG TPA: SPFH domain-containing protein [Planctomycetaceae bacterium]|nr:SPFH domain-containing protein [Planctomycetaceae bacterium]
MSEEVVFPEDHPKRKRRRHPDEGPARRMKSLFSSSFAFIVLLGLAGWFAYTQFRINVGEGEIAILIRKTGLDVKNGDEIAPTIDHKGVQREVLMEGYHFRYPYYWDWEIVKQEMIPKGKAAIRVSLTGENLPYGEFLAKVDEQGNPLTKGVMPGYLINGRYPINPYLFSIEHVEPINIEAGYVGVVTNLAGPIPEDPNTLLVSSGYRGVQDEALKPNLVFYNPYETRISLVDTRSQRYNLSELQDMGFPTKDGFWVSLDGIIEFRVKPDHAAEVYVTYNEDFNGDAIDEEIVNKIIMPNARSFCRIQGSNTLGRALISGDTRQQFQEQFAEAMRNACDPLGIEIIQALITRIHPPVQIAELVQQREIAKQNELQYQQQILQQESEQNLKIEEEMANQKEALVKADQKIVKVTTAAMQKQEVELTQSNQRLAVAKLKLEAAIDEAAAIVARGTADAKVIELNNAAEAAGWKRSVEAFSGDGNQFARYVMFQKLSASYRKLMINTADSPIMRVFESFAPGSQARPSTPPVVPEGSSETPVTTKE